MKKQYKQILMLTIGIVIHLSLHGQSYDPIGPTTNLCPGVTFRYTSPATALNGGSCIQNGWSCAGCLNPSDGSATPIAYGTDLNGRPYADVKWANTTVGGIGNLCGNLTVSILGNQQPRISANQNGLCGSGQITFTANNTSTANIGGYSWTIVGSGLSQTGDISTTANTLTLNYSNWTPSSSTVQVGVGSINSGCNNYFSGFLKTGGIMNVVAGNTNNLLVPYTFSPQLICTTNTIQLTNQPAGTTVSWSSGNTSGLTINSSTGAATRVNDFNGYAKNQGLKNSECDLQTDG